MFCFAPSRRRVPKEAPSGGGGEYIGMDDYGDEDEVHLPTFLFMFYFLLLWFRFCIYRYCLMVPFKNF